MRLPRALADELVAHARSELPNEACGILGGQDGTISSFHATRNADASPYRYTVDPQDAVEVLERIDEAGDDIVAIYHSHTKSAAYPSRTDVELAELWPGTAFIIVSLAAGGADLRAFFLTDGIEELELVVE
jgi:[CysO sulfur-carrier protein]-S-L-cysteine hydrolase